METENYKCTCVGGYCSMHGTAGKHRAPVAYVPNPPDAVGLLRERLTGWAYVGKHARRDYLGASA